MNEAEINGRIRQLIEFAKPIAANVQLRNVSLHSSTLRADLTKEDPPEHVEHGFQAGFAVNRQTNQIALRVGFVFHGHYTPDASLEDQAPVQVDAEFSLLYDLPSLDDIEDANVEAFAKVNGVFNAWPYWREYLQSSLPRLGLPSLTLPAITTRAIARVYAMRDGEQAAEPPSE